MDITYSAYNSVKMIKEIRSHISIIWDCALNPLVINEKYIKRLKSFGLGISTECQRCNQEIYPDFSLHAGSALPSTLNLYITNIFDYDNPYIALKTINKKVDEYRKKHPPIIKGVCLAINERLREEKKDI